MRIRNKVKKGIAVLLSGVLAFGLGTGAVPGSLSHVQATSVSTSDAAYYAEQEQLSDENSGGASAAVGASDAAKAEAGTEASKADGDVVSGGDVSGVNADGTNTKGTNPGGVTTGGTNAGGSAAAEKDAAVQAAQALIDALPDEPTAENADGLQAQLIAIDKALAELTDEQIAKLDMARYESICAALTGLVAVQADHVNHPICGATCNHTDAHKAVTWTGVSTLTDSMTSGYYYLTDDVVLNDRWWIANGSSIVLCLNGHSITVNKDWSAIDVTYGELTLCDCNGSTKSNGGIITHGAGYTGAGVCVDRSTFNMYGGTISGNSSSSDGGGVYVMYQGGTFNMYGGTIRDNSATGGGGGVYVKNNGMFHMYDGTISGNTAAGNNGGGVYVYQNGTFIMNGGSIRDNTAEGNLLYGGGVYVYGNSGSGTFTMTGGTISANTSYQGGGVYLETVGNNTFIMEGGSITGNTATKAGTNAGGGVYVTIGSNFTVSGDVQITDNKDGNSNANNVYLDATSEKPVTITIAEKLDSTARIGVTMSSPLIKEAKPKTFAVAGDSYNTLSESDANCFSSDQSYTPFLMDGEVKLFQYEPQVHPICGEECSHNGEHPDVIWIGVTKLNNIDADGNYYLVDNIDTAGGNYVPTKYNVRLCLNGKKISGGETWFNPRGKNYTLCDCKGTGTITGATSTYGSIQVELGSSLDMYGGVITGNKIGVVVDNGTFNMYGGEIKGNSYTGADGGSLYGGAAGVRVDENGTFNMSGSAKISGNTASFTTREDSAGYYGAAGVYVNGGTFTITENAEVSGNTLTTDESIGDGDNNYAGGVYVKNGNVTVGGNVKITGNKKGEKTSNVCLPKGQTITVNDALTGEIGVITETPITVVGEEAVIAKGTDSHPLTGDDKNAFSSDDNIPAELEDGQIIFRKGVHKHYICGKAACSDASHGHAADAKWTAISALSEINGDGYYFLTKNVDLTTAWECTYTGVELCLNGKTITNIYGWDVITVASGASLVITDCTETVGKITHAADQTNTKSGINVQGSFTLWNGSITGNQATNYGGVQVAAGGTFTMNGGSITDNATDGGVQVAEGGTFNMHGGSITKNNDSHGGVYVKGTFNMYGGDIAQNTYSVPNQGYGGGVYVEGGEFNMAGGSITQNGGAYGGGVNVSLSGTFTMKGGEITQNTYLIKSVSGGSGVYVGYNGTFTMDGGVITGNTSTSSAENGDGGGGVYVGFNGTFNMTNGEITGNANSAAAGGGGVNVGGKFNMTGGKITGNTNSAAKGGGVYVAGSGEFTMTGGEITGNNTSATDDSGAGGVYMEGTFTVSGAANITDNWKNGELMTGGVYGKGEGSTASNVCLPYDYRVITIGEEGLTQAAKLGVSVSTDMLPTEGYTVEIAENATGEQSFYRNIFSLDSEDPYYSIICDSEGKCLYIYRHRHDWKYSASGATITAKCEAADCPVKDGDGGSITIVAPAAETLVYDTNSKKATLQYKLLDEVGVNEDRIGIDYATDNTPLGTGKVPEAAGTYTASVSLEYPDGTKSDPAVVEYTIQRADPEAGNFGFDKPEGEDLYYSGNVKEIKNIWYRFPNGMGDITVRYFDANGSAVEPAPRNVGIYTFVIDVTEGRNYNAATGLTDSGWTFEILPSTTSPTVDLSSTTYTYTGERFLPEVTVKVGDTTLVKDTDYTVTYGANTDAGTGTVTVTAVQGGNYAFTEVQKEFTIEQAEPELSFGKSAESKTYIDEPFTNLLINKGDGDVTYTSSEESVATVDENGEVTIVGVGETTITAAVPATTNYKADEASYKLTVAQAQIRITKAGVMPKIYDGGSKADVISVDFADKQGKEVTGVFGEDYTAIGAFQDVNAGGRLVDIRVKLQGDFAKKYVLEADTYTTVANIEAKTISIGSATVKDRDYKQGDTSVTVSGVTFLDQDGNPCTMLTEGTDYTVTGVMEDANIGVDKGVTVTVTLLGDAKSNYYLSSGKTTTAKVTISKAAGGRLTAYNLWQKFSDRKEKTFTPDYILPDGEKWTYSISDAVVSGSASVEAVTIDAETGKISYKLTDGAENETVSWTVTITNDNYEKFTKEIVLTLTAKDPQGALYVTGDNTVVYGKTLTLGTTGGSGTGEVTFRIDKASSTGEATIDENGVLTPTKVGTVAVIAAKAGDAEYSEVTSTAFVITITKAATTGTPKYTEITTGGKTLADAGLTLTGSTISPADGTLEWVDDAGNALPGTTEVEANKTYKWRFTPTDDNYEILTGEAELYHKSTEIDPNQYKIIGGADSSWTQNTDGNIVIRGNGDFAKFQAVKVDGEVIDAKNYTVAQGSTIVTLKADYLKTLSAGRHSFEIVWTDGSAGTHFTVAMNNTPGNNDNDDDEDDNSSGNAQGEQSEQGGNAAVQTPAASPKTGDASDYVLWTVLLAVSVAGIAGVLMKKKKE